MVADAVNKTCNSSRRGLSNFIQVHYVLNNNSILCYNFHDVNLMCFNFNKLSNTVTSLFGELTTGSFVFR